MCSIFVIETSYREEQKEEREYQDTKIPTRFVQKHHLENLIFGDIHIGVQTRRLVGTPQQANFSLLSR